MGGGKEIERPLSLTSPAAFLAATASSREAEELLGGISEAIRARHAERTRSNYDYWLGRLQRWMENPSTRFRLRDLPVVSLDELWPIQEDSERVIILWLTDLNLGPVDPLESAEWERTSGPLAPSTLSGVIAALKARSGEHQAVGWTPSTWMSNALTGLRRQLRERYGPDRQAEPLLGEHVAKIAQHLCAVEAPDAARDRLILELHAAGVDGGGISRLRLDSIREPTPGISASTSKANLELYKNSGMVGLRSLAVPGQNRRGGVSDPSMLLTLADLPHLDAALSRYLQVRRKDPGELLVLLSSNRSHHVKSSLSRLANLAGVDWRPARSTWARLQEVRDMRHVLDAELDWSGQLRRRRDLSLLLVGYLCALRRGELCALRVRDVELHPDKAIITIPKSKTDQEQRGVRLAIQRPADVAAHVDAVHHLREWITLLRDEGAERDDPLFPALNRHGDALPSRVGGTYGALGSQSWSERLAELAREAQVFGADDTGRYEGVSGHSLRRGFVTTALLAGHDPIAVAKQTRHKNLGMLLTYADELRMVEGTDWAGLQFGGDPPSE